MGVLDVEVTQKAEEKLFVQLKGRKNLIDSKSPLSL